MLAQRLGWRGTRVRSGGQWTLPQTGLEGNEGAFWGTVDTAPHWAGGQREYVLGDKAEAQHTGGQSKSRVIHS